MTENSAVEFGGIAVLLRKQQAERIAAGLHAVDARRETGQPAQLERVDHHAGVRARSWRFDAAATARSSSARNGSVWVGES